MIQIWGTNDYSLILLSIEYDYSRVVKNEKRFELIGSQVAKLLRAEREKKGLSMNAVAERAGLSQSMVSLVEREMRNPTLDTLLRITAAIEVDLVEIIARAQRSAK